MEIERFEDLVDRLGEDIAQWPEPWRSDGGALLTNSAEAREIVAEAQLLRQAFARHDLTSSPAGLADRIVSQAHSGAAMRRSAFVDAGIDFGVPRAPHWFRPTIVLPLCFVLGLMFGLVPLHGSKAISHIEVPTFFEVCCGNWSAGRDD